MITITIFNEFQQEREEPAVQAVYPEGIHAVLAQALGAEAESTVLTATLDQPQHGLTEAVLAQRGVVGIFPEAGSWAAVLRPARPGTAFLAARTGARLMPMGLDGLIDVFPYLSRGRRACVTPPCGVECPLRVGVPPSR